MTESKDRFYLLDLLKVMTLLAIQTLHAWEFVFYQDQFQLQEKSVVYETMTYYARNFSLGGQVLVGIIYFLFGFKGKSQLALIKIAGFCLIGQFALMVIFERVEWDIYTYLIFCNLLLCLCLKFTGHYLALAATSLLALMIPPNFWQNLLPAGEVFDVLSGRLSNSNSGAWALLPWFFHALLFFSLGGYFRLHPHRLKRWHRLENYLWPLILLACLPYFGFYFHTPLGPNYYSFNFNQSSHLYWANFLPFIFWMRLSFLTSIQEKLSTSSIMRWISNLMWSRKVGLTYLTAIVYVGLASEFQEPMASIPFAFDLFYVSIMPMSEIVVRLVVKLHTHAYRLKAW